MNELKGFYWDLKSKRKTRKIYCKRLNFETRNEIKYSRVFPPKNRDDMRRGKE